MSLLPDKFKEVYEEYYRLHPNAAVMPTSKFYYLHRQWIFPNHIDVMLELVVDFRSRFYPNADVEIALFAALLHDAGLVYERKGSPLGHEERSIAYANDILRRHGYGNDFIVAVSMAIKATDPKVDPESDEATLVRNADAYSHLSTMHLFAKAHFADDLRWYVDWFDKKAHGCLAKLTIQELIADREPLIREYEKLVASYRRHLDHRYIDED